MSAMTEFAKQYYPEYDPNGGVVTSKTSGGMTFSNKKMTPETNPWAFINPGEVDVNGRINGQVPSRTGTGYESGRSASPEEIAASTAKNNYFKNGGKGLDPRLMAGMKRNDFRSNQYRNQYGTYNQQHATIDQARKAQGLDPWMEQRSSFQGKGLDGKPVNYANQGSVWGNRGPGGFGDFANPISQALRNPAAGGGSPPPAAPPSAPPGTLPGNGSLPGGPPSAGPVGGNYIGLPPGNSQPGGPGKVPPSMAQWWQQMMARRPGQQ